MRNNQIKETKGKDGIPLDGIAFHPYYTVKDIFGLGVFLIFFLGVVFYLPEFFGFFLEPDNFSPADNMATPEHIAPVWYMTPFYAILRAIPDKLMGVVAMVLAIAVIAALPWLDRSKVRSIRYRGWMTKLALALFTVSFILLGYLGMQPVTPMYTWLARLATVVYFAFFFLMPLYTKYDRVKPLPERVR